jgi:tetratricopeptide (TPR) repeat protein
MADEWYRENWHGQLPINERAREYARRAGDRHWEVTFLAGTVGSLEIAGRWDEAIVNTEEAEPHATTEFARGLLLWVVLVHCHRGDVAAARTFVDRHADIAGSGNQEFAGGYGVVLGLVLACEGRFDEALEQLELALAGRPEEREEWWLDFIALEAASHFPDDERIAAVLRTVGKVDRRATQGQKARLRARLPDHDAVDELSNAVGFFQEVGAPFYAAAAQLELAEHLLAAGDADAAESLLAEARDVFSHLRAVPYLERVDALAQREPSRA